MHDYAEKISLVIALYILTTLFFLTRNNTELVSLRELNHFHRVINLNQILRGLDSPLGTAMNITLRLSLLSRFLSFFDAVDLDRIARFNFLMRNNGAFN